MKNKKLLIIIAAGLAIFIVAALVYNALSERAMLDNIAINQTAKTTSIDASNSISPSATGVTAPALKEGLNSGDLAYDFTVVDKDGKDVTLSDLRGQIVILNFWASWCPPCKAEMPDFQKLQEELDAQGEDAQVRILAVGLANGYRNETIEVGAQFIKDQGYTFPVAFDTGDVATQYQISSIPTTFILDKDGVIVTSIKGMTSKAVLDSILKELTA